MGIYIKGEMPTGNDELRLIIHSNGQVFISHKTYFDETEAIPVSPHGRLIDANEFLKRAIGTKCFRGDYALMLEELAGESTTIIPAEEVYGQYTDTAGNFHWTGTHSGAHTIKA